MKTETRRSLGERIEERARAADRRLRANDYYRRLIAGSVDADEYAAWLVQLHKYVRFTVPGEQALVDAMKARKEPNARALRSYAEHERDEESGHDDLLVADLAVVWGVSRAEALARIDAEPCSPSVDTWSVVARFMHGHHPEGIIGFGMALERLASLQSDEKRANLVAQREIPGIERAVRFLEAHSAAVESDHAAGGSAIADALLTPNARASALFFADVALAMYESLVHWLDERFPTERVPRALEGATS